MALPIRQRLSALTCLKAGPKAVLMEVCELHENGGRGCFASNDALSKKLGVSLATVTRTVASLTAWGMLSARVVAAEGNRRYLAPTAAVRACYASNSEVQQLDALANLTIVKSKAESEMTIVKSEADYSQNSEVTIVKNDVDYSQTASRVYGDDQDDQVDDQLKRYRAALAEVEGELAAAQKKIAQLETQLQAEREASHTRGVAGSGWQYDPAAIAGNLVLPFATDTFRQMWAAYRQYRHEKRYSQFDGGMQEQEALRHLGNLAQGSEAAALEIIQYSTRGGYKSLCKPDGKRPSTIQPGQSGAGAKPVAADAADVAEFLVRRRFNQPGGTAGDTGQTTGTYAGQSPIGAAGVSPHANGRGVGG